MSRRKKLTVEYCRKLFLEYVEGDSELMAALEYLVDSARELEEAKKEQDRSKCFHCKGVWLPQPMFGAWSCACEL